MGLLVLVLIAAIALAIVGGLVDGLKFLLAIGLIVFMLAIIVAAARYLRTQWRR